MRKVTLYMQISLDGVVSNPEQWMTMSDDILSDAIDYYKTLDTVVFGSKTYPWLADYWPTAEHSSNSPTEREFAKRINNIHKLVLSRSSVNLTWNNSQHLSFTDRHTFVQAIQDLKNKSGKNISVESGIGAWRLFLQNALFDELLLYVHPVIAGKGEKLFTDIDVTTILKLKHTKVYDNGVVALHYERAS
jgi:dihydrofolate reductase